MTEYEPVLEGLGEARKILQREYLRVSEIMNREHSAKKFSVLRIARCRIWKAQDELQEISDDIFNKLVAEILVASVATNVG